MEYEARPGLGDDITLPPRSGVPFSFTVTITGAGTKERPARTFKITGLDPKADVIITREYRLPDREHNSYLDLFANLARDFGARFPKNRRPLAEPTFRAEYKVLLTENLAPGMLYGYGDPAVLRVEERAAARYYLVVTSNDAPNSFPIIRSRDLESWEFVGYVFPGGKKPEWAADGEYISDYWAPEMHKVGGEFRVYFGAREKNTHVLSIGMAKSSRPTGQFIAEKRPILSDNTIDPHVFVDDGGTAFLFWKKDNNDIWPARLTNLLYEHPEFIDELLTEKQDRITASLIETFWPWTRTLEPMERFFVQQILIETVTLTFSAFYDRLVKLTDRQSDPGIKEEVRAVLQVMRTPVYAQKLSTDGSSLVDEPTRIIENDQAWEAHLIEGIWLTKHGGRYYLFYAGNDFSTAKYGIGVAVGDSPLGPYRKMAEPLLKSTKEWSGPGHPSVALGLNGEPLLFFHAFFPGRMGYKEFRALLAARIDFKADHVRLK